MMRVLYVNPSAQIGGAERCLLALIRGLPRDRFEAHLMLPKDGPLVEQARSSGAQVVVDPWPAAVLKMGREPHLLNRALLPVVPLLLAPAIIRLRRYVRAHGIDVVHTNGIKAHLAACGATLTAGRPLIWHLRDIMRPGPLRALIRLLGRVAPEQIIANSRATAASLGHRGHGRLCIVHDGIGVEEFAPRPPDPNLRRSLGLAENDFVIGAVGALTPLKGHIHLIGAMPRVLVESPRARLLIVGGEMYDTLGHAGYRRILETEAVRLGVRDRLVLAGRREDLPAVYNVMDLVAFSSIRPESFGMVLVEAMASGRPVVATDLGGPREIISGPEVGILVPPANPEAMAAAILSLWRDPSLRERMARRGRERVVEKFTTARSVAGVCAVYDRIQRGLAPRGRDGLQEAPQ